MFRAPALILCQAGLSTFRLLPETVSLKHPQPLYPIPIRKPYLRHISTRLLVNFSTSLSVISR